MAAVVGLALGGCVLPSVTASKPDAASPDASIAAGSAIFGQTEASGSSASATAGAPDAAASGGGGGQSSDAPGAAGSAASSNTPVATPPASSGGSQATLAQLGAACSTSGTAACAALGSPQVLRCDGAQWIDDTPCTGSEVCGYASRSAQRCVPEVAECRDHKPGAQVCAAEALRTCSDDLLSSSMVMPCTGLKSCQLDACVCKNPCGNDCPDFTSDKNHCGACNHACDGTCERSKCAPKRLATAGDWAFAVGVDATSVYWVESMPGRVMKTSVDGGQAQMLASSSGRIEALALDANSLYYTDGTGAVVRLAKSGGTPTTLVASDAYGPVATDGSRVYFQSSAGLQSVSVTGGSPVTLAQETPVAGIAVSGGEVFWTTGDQGGVRKVSLSGGASQLLQTVSGARATTIVADAHNVYWTDELNTAIHKVSRNGGDGAMFSRQSAAATGLALDANSLYWVEYSGSGTVMKQALSASTAVTLADSQANSVALCVDSKFVYWLNRGYSNTQPGDVMKIAF